MEKKERNLLLKDPFELITTSMSRKAMKIHDQTNYYLNLSFVQTHEIFKKLFTT